MRRYPSKTDGLTAAFPVFANNRTFKDRDGDEAHVHPAPTAIVADVSEAVEWIEKTLC